MRITPAPLRLTALALAFAFSAAAVFAKPDVAESKDLLEHPRPSPAASASKWEVSVSVVAENGMPKNIVPKGAGWNFGPGSVWSHHGWQYATYWDDACQVSVARRQLPNGAWETLSLPDYQRTASGDRGKDPGPSFGFGDGHEKISLGISPDGFIHLSFDHHRSTLRYRVTKLPVANDPKAHAWKAELFGPVQNHLGGPKLEDVTYPSFTTDGDNLVLYLRLGGGSGAGNSHYFTYSGGKWLVNTEPETQFLDKNWSGGDKTVNAYIQGLIIHNGRWHITWCWRDTPDATTCHDFCYAYSDDRGKTWCNNDGEIIGIAGQKFITADSPGIAVWKIPTKSNYRNGGSMTVDRTGRVHALAHALDGNAIYFSRDPVTRQWTREDGHILGTLLVGPGDDLLIATPKGLFQTSARRFREWKQVSTADAAWFEDSKMAIDPMQGPQNDRISTIGQQGKTIRVVEYKLIKP